MSFILRLLINTAALWCAVKFVPGIHFDGTPLALVGVAAVFGLVNASIGVIARIITFPVTVLTLGLFMFVLNGLLFWIAGAISTSVGLGYHVDGFWPAFAGAIITGLASIILTLVVRAARTGSRDVERL